MTEPGERKSLPSRLKEAADSFPAGKAILFLIFVAGLCGMAILAQPKKPKADIEFWTFAKPHYESYVKVLPAFLAKYPGLKVNIQLMGYQALHQGLRAGFISGKGLPDLVEIETSQAGTFFAGPLEGIGFLDLTDRLNSSGLLDRMVRARFATYTTRGHIFGVPHDIHPLLLAYNKDLFAQAGIDVNKLETWEDFIREGKKLVVDLDGDKRPDRYAMELDSAGSYIFEILLKQRGVTYFHADGSLALGDPLMLDSLVTYIRMVAGPEKIGNNLGGGAILTKAVMEGYLASLILPDWRVGGFKQEIPKAAGMLRVMPLPAWEKGGRHVSTWGGTMMGITKACDKAGKTEMAWEFLQHMYFNPADLGVRYEETGIVPCLKEAWNLPVFKRPEPYFGGQPVGELFTKYADQVPPTQNTPFTNVVNTKMSEVVDNSARWYEAHPGDLKGLREFGASELERVSKVIRLQIGRFPFYEP